MTSNQTKIKVLIVEDIPIIRDVLYVQLTMDARTKVVGVAENVEDASRMLQALRPDLQPEGNSSRPAKNSEFPDVVLVDIRYRKPSGEDVPQGLELIRLIKEMRDSVGDLDVKILCLSQCIQPDVVVEAIKAGANGYIDKLQAVEGWIEAIRLVHRGRYVFSPNISREVMFLERFTHIDNVEIFAPEEIRISDRARQVALLYFRARMTAREIAEELGISESTVWYHVGKIRQSDYIVVALGKDQ
jgi:DNA-binding NarL/FixJ family response regulator